MSKYYLLPLFWYSFPSWDWGFVYSERRMAASPRHRLEKTRKCGKKALPAPGTMRSCATRRGKKTVPVSALHHSILQHSLSWIVFLLVLLIRDRMFLTLLLFSVVLMIIVLAGLGIGLLMNRKKDFTGYSCIQPYGRAGEEFNCMCTGSCIRTDRV